MSEDFDSACSWLSSSSAASALSNETKLELYGLFKVIKTGSGPTGTRPSVFSFERRAKYDAWSRAAQEHSNETVAMSRYVRLAQDAGWRQGALPEVASSDNDRSSKASAGMGVSVSVMAQNDTADHPENSTHSAAARGDVDSLKVLLADKTLLNAKDDFGYTPLHIAVDRERTEAVRYLLALGADKAVLDQDGQTALDIAELLSNAEISALLR